VSVLFQSTEATQAESLRYDLGHAAAQLQVLGPDVPGMRQDPVEWQRTETRTGSPASEADGDDPLADPLQYVPAGAVSIPVVPTQVVLEGRHGPVGLPATEGSTWAPALEGHWHVVDGTAPTSRDQLMLTPATLDRLGLRIGDTVDMTDPATRRFTVTGTIRDLGLDVDQQGVFVPWGTTTTDRVPAPSWRSPSPTELTVYLPDVAPTWDQITALNAHGIVVQSRPVVLDPPDARLRSAGVPGSGGWYLAYVSLTGVFAMFEVVLLAGAAFLVGTRADTRSYAILASVGGGPRFVRTVVVGSGLVLGLCGAVVGALLGVGIGVGAFHLLDDGVVTRFPGLHVPAMQIVSIAAAAVLAGVVASLAAARAATKVNALAALRGSTRPATASPAARKRRRIWGPALVVLGAAMTLACGMGVLVLNDRPVQEDRLAFVVGAGVAIGPCLVQLGVAICSPWVLALVARIAGRLGPAARMAARDARRNPVRTVPVLASVMSVVFVASVLLTYSASGNAGSIRDWQYRTAIGVATADVTLVDDEGNNSGYDPEVTAHAAQVVDRVLDTRFRVLGVVNEMPGAHPTDVTYPHDFVRRDCPANNTTTCNPYLQSQATDMPHIWAGTTDDYAVLTGHRPSRSVRDALADGRAVALWPEYVHDGAVQLDTFRDRTITGPGVTPDTRPDAVTRVPAVLDVQTPRIQVGVFMTRETAARYDVPAIDGMLMAKLPADLGPTEWDALSSAWQASGGADRDRWGGPSVLREDGPQSSDTVVQVVALGLTAAVTIGATAVAIGLGRVDGRRDDEVLAAIGAAPGLRRRISTWQAAILTLVGAVVGTLLGLLPIRALTLRLTATPDGVQHLPFAPDWSVMAVLAVGLPLVVTVATWATSGRMRRLPVRRAH
jgi:ABC-type lipoprotein release transport system permease subunit